MGRLPSRQSAVRKARLGDAESLSGSSCFRNIDASQGDFQPHRRPRLAPIGRGSKMRLAAPQKTIYNQPARDGTPGLRRGFFLQLADFSLWLGAMSRRPSLRGADSAANE
jgi:hypothetical protein